MTTFTLQNDNQSVTAVICHLVKPGQEQVYEEWLHDISAVAQQFEGHSGVSFVRPEDRTHPEYAIILKFDRYANLKKWMDSAVRQHWIDKAKPLVQEDQKVQILTGLETWFTLPGQLVKHPPARYKMAILTIATIFLLAQLLQPLFTLILVGFPPLLRALVMTIVNVLLLTYVVMPRVTRLFYRWLYPKSPERSKRFK